MVGWGDRCIRCWHSFVYVSTRSCLKVNCSGRGLCRRCKGLRCIVSKIRIQASEMFRFWTTDCWHYCTVGITVLCTNVILLSRSRDSCVQHTADPTSRALDNSNSLFHDNANLGGGGGGGGGMGRRPLDLTSSLRAKPDLIETAEQRGGSRDSNK